MKNNFVGNRLFYAQRPYHGTVVCIHLQFLITCLLIFVTNFSFSQNPLIKQWDYRFGGTNHESLTDVHETFDKGFILGGVSFSGMNGDKTQDSWGGLDFWVVKIDALGNKTWDRRYGGNGSDALLSVVQTLDGGYMLGGKTSSEISGDITQASQGGVDYWIVKIDTDGNIQWQKRLGGSANDYLESIQQCKDKGFMLGGYSLSGIGGDKTQNSWGSSDYWIVKVDSVGNYEWDKGFGGTDADVFSSLQQTADGGYILGGHSESLASGNKTQSSWGHYDYWIVKIDSSGNYSWDKSYGGTSAEYLNTVEQTSDHGYILSGGSYSMDDGNKTQPNWDTINFTEDYWIVKVDSLGNYQWDRDFGGTDTENDAGHIFQASDGGYLVGGASYSGISGDKTEDNLGARQVWIIKTDSSGSKQWDKTIFVDGQAVRGFVLQTKEGCYVIADYTNSGVGGYKTQPSQGDYDYWIIKFCDTTDIGQLPQSDFNSNSNYGCPNSCFDFTNASLNANTYKWFFNGGNPSFSLEQNPSNICYASSGDYDVMLVASSSYASDTLVLPGYINIFNPIAIAISQNGNFLTCNPEAISYQWLLNGNQIPGATSQSLFINQTGIYSVEVADSNSCPSSSAINVTSLPSTGFSANDNFICEKFCVSFFDLSTNNPTAWQWIFEGGFPDNSSFQNPTNICYNIPGVYSVTLITTNAFGKDTLALNNYLMVYVTPDFPVIVQDGNTLTSSIADAYQWQFNTADITGATNQSYTATETGLYTVIISDSNGCVNSASKEVIISTISEVNGNTSVWVYPNPSKGNFLVEVLNDQPFQSLSITIENALGQKIYYKKEYANSSSFRKEIQLKKAPAGIYLVTISGRDKVYRKKILIE